MSGIRELMGFYYWLDNDSGKKLESALHNKGRLTKEQLEILKELKKEHSDSSSAKGKNPNAPGK